MTSGKNERKPFIALAGRPNVGKSTLFNRLTRSRDALVDFLPGVTRDRRYAAVSLGGIPAEIIDTGGLEDTNSPENISALVSRESMKAVEQADVIFFLMDGREGLTPVDEDIARMLRAMGKPVFYIVNKVDNRHQEMDAAEFYSLGVERLYPISAAHGRGVTALLDDAGEMLEKLGFSRMEAKQGEHGAKAGDPSITEGDDITSELGLPDDDQPIRVSIIGRPNVGKSSLLNRFAGHERMIVADMPGTTRDAVDTLLHRENARDIVFTDTAGIRRRARVRDKIEKFSIIKAIDAVKDCDIALVVLDATEGITDQDQKLIGYTEQYGKACVTLYNKFDLIQKDSHLVKLRNEELKRAKRFIPYAPHLNISALTGKRVERIFPLIDRIYTQYNATCSTGRANRILQRAVARRNPPISKGHHLKLYYTTQVAVRPPTFVIFANYPDKIPDQYRRFLINRFREELELPDVPVRIIFRQRERREK